MRIPSVAITLLCSAMAIACASPQRWEVKERPERADIAALLNAGGSLNVATDLMESEVPPVPVRTRLRPCCAFGSDLRAELGPVPIPGYQIPNIIGPDDVGPHSYDSGRINAAKTEDVSGIAFNDENNGLVYTCRGGFIDIAHVRDYVDWSTYAAGEVGRILLTGEPGEFSLPNEGGKRRVLVSAIDSRSLEIGGVRRLAAWLGAYVGWYSSVWHELATWYGYRSVPGFSEKASAFSIEDLFSNALGAKLSNVLVDRRLARSERTYNLSVDDWLAASLEYLGAVPREVGREAAEAVDGLWWDSTRRLPDNRLVMRRNLDQSFPLRPWLLPPDSMPQSLRDACGDAPEAAEISAAHTLDSLAWVAELVTLEIVVDKSFLVQEPFTQLGRTVTQRDFGAITEVVRHQILEELGPDADRPE